MLRDYRGPLGDFGRSLRLSGLFFCLQSHFLFVFDLLLLDLLVEVAPVATRHDELVDFQLRMNTLSPFKQVGVQWIGCGEPDTGETVSALPLYTLEPLL